MTSPRPGRAFNTVGVWLVLSFPSLLMGLLALTMLINDHGGRHTPSRMVSLLAPLGFIPFPNGLFLLLDYLNADWRLSLPLALAANLLFNSAFAPILVRANWKHRALLVAGYLVLSLATFFIGIAPPFGAE
ncbi:MAG TPA: hypothetical protein VF459_16190 [Caulobacteraceae bacterium]